MIFILYLLICISPSFGGKVAVSIFPFYDLVREIAGKEFTVEVVVPPKADYHVYELTAKDLLKLHKADIVFISGIPLGYWEEKIEKIAGERAVRLVKNPKLNDPHIWLSPKEMIRIAKIVADTFEREDPERKEIYRERLKRVVNILKSLDREYSEGLKNCKFRILATVHRSLSYIAKDYKLREISLSFKDIHSDISPHSILLFVKEIKKRGISHLIVPLGEKYKVAEVLSKKYNLKVYEINIKIIPTIQSSDYFSVMLENLKKFKEILQCM